MSSMIQESADILSVHSASKQQSGIALKNNVPGPVFNIPLGPKPIQDRQLLLPLPPKDGNFVLYDLQRIEVVHKQFMKSYEFPRRMGRIVAGYRKMEKDLKELESQKPRPLDMMPKGPTERLWKYDLKMTDTTVHEIGWLSGRPECTLELFGLDKKYHTRNLNVYQLGHHFVQQR